MRDDVFFLDVDTQRCFMDEDGSLYVEGAIGIRENLRRLTDFAVQHGITIIATEDAHDEDDPEFQQFPPHCVKGSEGARKIDETSVPNQARIEPDGQLPSPPGDLLKAGQIVLEKQTFSAFTNPAIDQLLATMPDATAVVYGVATEYCVKSAVEGLLERGRTVSVVTDAVKGVTPDGHRETLESFEKAGAKFALTREVLDALDKPRH
jgi:nicotinamidase/pyrazinamidase